MRWSSPSKRVGDDTQLAVAITSDGDDPLAIGKERVADALAAGYDAMLAPHRKWWAELLGRLPRSACQTPESSGITTW